MTIITANKEDTEKTPLVNRTNLSNYYASFRRMMMKNSPTGLTEDGSESSGASLGEQEPMNPSSQSPQGPSGGGANYTNTTTVTFSSNDDNSSSSSSSNLILLVSVAAATAATLGYDVGIMAAAIQPLVDQMHLTDIQKEIAMGSLNFVAAFGAFLGGHVADAYGRKRTISLCCWLFVVGTLFMAGAWNYAVLLLGRIVTGLGVGVAFVTAPCYITEVAPADSRGQLNTVFDISINGGILVGYVTGFLVQLFLPDNWRIMLACGMVLPLLILALLHWLPESPRWLMMQYRKSEAEQVLQYHLGNSSSATQQILQEMQEEIDREQRTKPPRWGKGQQYAVRLGFWQQITGTEAVLYYSADYLGRAGLESPLMRLGGNVFVGICKLVPECIAMHYIDTAGRRPLLFGSALTLFLSILSLSIAFSAHATPVTIVILLCAVMASFSAGLGPFTFLSASENLAMSERAAGITYCTAANRVTSGLVAMTAVSLTSLLGDAGLFGLYAAAGFLSLFFYWNVPETAGLSLEELAARNSFDNSNSHSNHSGNGSDRTGVEIPDSNFQVMEGQMA